jgi:hypothetical protein
MFSFPTVSSTEAWIHLALGLNRHRVSTSELDRTERFAAGIWTQ